MEVTVIEAECVEIHCYCGTKDSLMQAFSEIQSQKISERTAKAVKVIFFIQNLTLKEYSSIYESLKSRFS